MAEIDTLVVVLGDSPRMSTGLGRIAGDLAYHLWRARERLGIELVQLGWEYGRPPLHAPVGWPLVTFPEIGQDWGYAQVAPLVEQLRAERGYGPQQVVLFTVWDPARCFDYHLVSYAKWGYFAVDGHNRQGRFGGPAAEAVQRYDRVLGYTDYGAEVLSKVLDPMPKSTRPVQWLPHGHYWGPAEYQQAHELAEPPQQGWRLGCVASNTPRKDLGLFFAVIRQLRDRGERVYGWLHTDELVTAAWSVPELLEVYDLDPTWVQISLPPAGDAWLRSMYAGCACTLAPGRGEGFCYPIVESLAMGRAAVHADYAGGAELTPPEGRIPVAGGVFDATNPYCVQRPIVEAEDAAERCLLLAHRALVDATLAAHYAGSVAHLHWQQLWPRWETWWRQGLRELRERR